MKTLNGKRLAREREREKIFSKKFKENNSHSFWDLWKKSTKFVSFPFRHSKELFPLSLKPKRDDDDIFDDFDDDGASRERPGPKEGKETQTTTHFASRSFFLRSFASSFVSEFFLRFWSAQSDRSNL